MAVWTKVLSLTASHLSPIPGFESHTGAYEKVASDLGLGSGYGGYSCFQSYSAGS